MSKYDSLWKHIQRSGEDSLDLTFDEIATIAGLPIDHSFLNYKKELLDYGYEVGKISLKNKTVHFKKLSYPEPNEESLQSIRETDEIIASGGTGRSFASGRELLDAEIKG